MEKTDTNRANPREGTQEAKGKDKFTGCCMSCCAGTDITGEKTGKEDFCKGMPDQEKMDKMMKMCCPKDKKTE